MDIPSNNNSPLAVQTRNNKTVTKARSNNIGEEQINLPIIG